MQPGYSQMISKYHYGTVPAPDRVRRNYCVVLRFVSLTYRAQVSVLGETS